MQGTQVQSLVQEDFTCYGATKPRHHNYWNSPTLEPVVCKKEATATRSLCTATAAAAAAKSLQSRATLCNPIDGSPPGSSVPRILQARTLEWVAISFSNAWKWKVKVKSLSRVWLCATPWTAAYQAPPSMEFSRQEYWSGSPVPFSIHLLSMQS